MVVSPEVLADELNEELPSVHTEVLQDDRVLVEYTYSAGLHQRSDIKAFEKDVKQFLMEYTAEWSVSQFSNNRVEGVHTGVIERDA